MDEIRERGGEREESFAPEISSKHLPAVTYRDLPEPLPLKRVIGPGVILAAAGIGSGEYVLWPYISQQVGLGFLWAALFGSIMMFFIATECVRYTLATGETAITGFTRLWKPWWIGFIIMAIVPNFWPGYATGVGTLITFIFGGGNVILITILALLAIALSLTLSPVVYQFLEKAQSIMMALMLLFIILATFVIFNISASAWGDFIQGFGSIGKIPGGIPFSVLAGAVAFAGAGGLGVVVVSNYVRDKGLGMGIHIPRIISPITGAEEAGSNIGHFFPQNEENMSRWRSWWRVANWDQFLTFFLFTVATIFVMSVLAYATVFGKSVGEEFDFIRAEGKVLGEVVAPWFTIFFWITGVLALFSTNLGVFDLVGRISADALKANWLLENRFWTESKLYATIITLLFISGVLVLVIGLQEPVVLLVISAVLNGVTSFIYSALLIQLNRFMLPGSAKMGSVRVLIMCIAVVFYGFFFIVTVLSLLGVVA
jgi:Mn2+/Fe2+ NRAMP family transporter